MNDSYSVAEKHGALTLLVDGKRAFPEIIRCIEAAKRSLLINMFIWRDDEIGNRVAGAVLDAANRGVRVEISVDRYGVVLEKSEEAKKSFFHKKQSFAERFKIRALEIMFPMPGAPRRAEDTESELYRAILSHPNIKVSADEFKADHSKFYVIDDEVLILGGVNIEDKENGKDMQGREYGDYMVKIVGEAYVKAFFARLKRGEPSGLDCEFGVNVKRPQRRFEMEEKYLSMIRSAKRELHITMAYFSPLRHFLDEIVAAHERGVAVTVMIPERANYQNDSNYKTVKKLMKRTKNGIRLLLSPKMLHTKLVVTEQTASFGSTNITKKAFAQLSELNLFVEREPTPFVTSLIDAMENEYALARQVEEAGELHYRVFRAALEGLLV